MLAILGSAEQKLRERAAREAEGGGWKKTGVGGRQTNESGRETLRLV